MTPRARPINRATGYRGASADRGSDRQLAQVLTEFARTLGTEFPIQKILDHLVQCIVDILPVTGAGVMVMGEHDDMKFVAASDQVVLQIEGLQNEFGEGPCIEAFRTGGAVAVTDLRDDARFPRFSPRALADGLAAVFTFPMRMNGRQLGAVDLYRDSPGPLSKHDLRSAQTLADIAAAYLFNAQTRLDLSASVGKLNHLRLHDPLTGLPNRVLLEELLQRAVARSRRSHHNTAVLFADLDGFKAVNDRFGHDIGDRLLVAVAARLTGALRPGDSLARLGGDEFVMVCEDLHDSSEAQPVAERITTTMAEPFDIDGEQITVTTSVGIAFSGPGQDVPEALLRDADFAMYQAKNAGGSRHRVIDQSLRLSAGRRDDLQRDVRQALSHAQLHLAYQPIVDMGTGELVAVEALLRWQHPQRGTVSPDILVPVAERTGAILGIGEWVLRQACQDLQQWAIHGPAVPQVAVNVSALQIMGPTFAETVAQVLSDTGTEPGAVCLELTESAFLDAAPRAQAVLREVRSFGVQLALDDFGTGYSSLSYLRQFPFDSIKIDRSFTAALISDKVTASIVAATIDLSHDLDLTVTAEGIETPDELTAYTDLGADQAQGFHLGRPRQADQLCARLLDEDRPSAG